MRVEQAIELASRFHEGAVDKAGRPYIGHILRVVNAVATHEEKLAAAMHVKGCHPRIGHWPRAKWPHEYVLEIGNGLSW
jgi:hypothetical protein